MKVKEGNWVTWLSVSNKDLAGMIFGPEHLPKKNFILILICIVIL
jgi:hypothetical protein